MQSKHIKRLSYTVASLAAVIAWITIGFFLLLAVGVYVEIVPNSETGALTGLGVLMASVLVACVLIRLILVISLKCPHCGRRSLIQGARIHTSFPTKGTTQQWAIQAVRFLKTKKIQCLYCASEIFDDQKPYDPH